MRAVFIYDFSTIFHILEVDIIRTLVDTKTLGLGGFTINDIKIIWLTDRLEETKLMHFGLVHDSPKELFLKWQMKNLSQELDRLIFNQLEHIPHYFLQFPARLEIRGNDLYVSFNVFHE